jgi:hypothetical protein
MKIRALLSCCFLFSQSFAILRPDPCSWGVQGEYLCLKSRSEQSDFALQITDSGNTNKIINNQGHFQSGFRLEGVYGIDPLHDVRVRFTGFHPGLHLRSVSGIISDPFLPEDAPFLGSASSNLGFKYYAIEALYGRWLYDTCNFDLALQTGLVYSNIKTQEKLTFSPLIPSTQSHAATFIHHSRFWGFGPEIAIDFQYPCLSLPYGIVSIAANARGAILASVTKAQLTEIISPATVTTRQFHGESIWRATPAFDARIGLNWEYPCLCFDALLEVGYEWIWTHNAANKNTTLAIAINQYSDVNFQGPYVALGIGF